MLAFLLIACQIDQGAEGTAVGNPTGMSVKIAPADDLAWSSGRAEVTRLDLTDCEDAVTSVDVGERLDLLGATELTVPEGTWCSLALVFGSHLELVALGPDDATATLRLDVPSVRLTFGDDTVAAPGGWVLELASPGWTDAKTLGVEDDAQIVVLPGGDLAVELAALITEESALFVDLDTDGAIAEPERDAGAIAEASADDDDDKDKDKDKDKDNGRGRNNPQANPGNGHLDTGDNPGVGREDGRDD